MDDLEQHLAQILTPELCLSVYRLKFPFAKQELPSGSAVGQFQFGSSNNMQAFYDLIFHSTIIPLSKIPFDKLITFDLKKLLLDSSAPEYPEHCLGLVQILDQSRALMVGYGFRYTRSFFDPLCEKLARELIALPNGIRPDDKRVWLSRGYSFDDWIVRVLWFWAPLVHSDTFMTADRQHLKDWLHYIRSEVETYYSVRDPFAHLEASDDVDVALFDRIVVAGPPLKSYADPDAEATIADYAFWWLRILNAHFAITDMCGHYPYKMRYQGLEWTAKDREFMEKTDWYVHGLREWYRYDPADEPVLEQVRKDYLEGVWQPLEPNPKFESGN